VSSQAISASILIREFTRELREKNAAVFAGAGLSMDSGYVDWKTLLKEIIQDLGLDPDREHDLVTLAQYHCNRAGGNKNHLTQTIINHFSPTKFPTPNHRLLARLPINTYWTTNYDKLLEKALEEAKKIPDVKYTLKQLSVTRPDRDVIVYKMHGDIDHAAEAVISKDDYEEYPLKMSAFVSALRGDLVEKTFLFLGFSFTDPNIDYILSRVRAQYERHQRHHYCILRSVSRGTDESPDQFKHRQLMQDYFIEDLKRFSIYTVLVDEYSEITEILELISATFKSTSVFMSGAAEDFGTWDRLSAERFLHKLSFQIAAERNRIITGFGVGVGGAVINGALAYLNSAGKTITDDALVMRPFPQVATGGANLGEQWTEYRKAMLDHAGIAIFLFGNKRDATGKLVLSNGMREEFDLSIKAKINPLPIGATGFMANDLWKEVQGNFTSYYPHASASFSEAFARLSDPSVTPDELLNVIRIAMHELQKA
jgi:hypothetical protein